MIYKVISGLLQHLSQKQLVNAKYRQTHEIMNRGSWNMDKKILAIGCICAVVLLVAISFASAISTNTVKPVERKDSPLFRIRVRKAIREKMGNLISSFIGERVFFLPFQWLINSDGVPIRMRIVYKSAWYTDPACGDPDCYHKR